MKNEEKNRDTYIMNERGGKKRKRNLVGIAARGWARRRTPPAAGVG